MKKFKKAILLLLIFCVAVTQCVVVSAEAKSKVKSKTKTTYELTLNKEIYTLKEGKSVTLKAKLNKAAKGKKVVWTSSNEKVASVNKKGKVRALDKGTAKITAKIEGTNVKETCKIVVGTPVTKVSINQKKVTLNVGETFTLVTTLKPKKPSNDDVIYESEDESIATVSKKGVITAVGAGKTTITVTAADGTGKHADCKVTVNKPQTPVTPQEPDEPEKVPESIEINKEQIALEPGQTDALKATVKPADAVNAEVTWSSSDENIVTVDENGAVKAIGEGNAYIMASTSNNKQDTCSVNVAYSGNVTSQEELNHALESAFVTSIVYTSDATETIQIPQGDYQGKTIAFYTPNAKVINNGSFDTVALCEIAADSYEENGSNYLSVSAADVKIKVNEGGSLILNLTENAAYVSLQNDGTVSAMNIVSKVNATISGSSEVAVSVRETAAESSFTTSTPLKIDANAHFALVILPGGEATTGSVNISSSIPAVAGLGCIPVTVLNLNDVVNVMACTKQDTAIDKRVTVSGTVENVPSVSGNSVTANACLIPYTNENADLDETNYESYLVDQSAAATTDADGNYVLSDVLIGNYWMIFTEDGYKTTIQQLVLTSETENPYTNGTISMIQDAVELHPVYPRICGTLSDSWSNDTYVPGIEIKLRKGVNNVTGEVIETALSDDKGFFGFEELTAGAYTIEMIDSRQNLPVNSVRYKTEVYTTVLSNNIAEDGRGEYSLVQDHDAEEMQEKMKFTFAWKSVGDGTVPNLKTHLIGPNEAGRLDYHVGYGKRRYLENGLKLAEYQNDYADNSAPQYTTVYEVKEGIYRFYVSNFDNTGMSALDTEVTVAIAGRETVTFSNPTGEGSLWHVCDYDTATGELTPINECCVMDENYYDGNTGFTEEEVAANEVQQAKDWVLQTFEQDRDMLSYFDDNAARQKYIDCIDAAEEKLKTLTTTEEAYALQSKVSDETFPVSNLYVRPNVIWNDYEQHIYKMYVSDCYTQERTQTDKEELCKTLRYDYELIGDEVGDFIVEEMSDEYSMDVEAVKGKNYQYVVHVKHLDTGLSYDSYLNFVSDVSEKRITDEVMKVMWKLYDFEDSAQIQDIRTRLQDYIGKEYQLKSNEDLEKILYEIRDIGDELPELHFNFNNPIDYERVKTDGYSRSWVADENGAILGTQTYFIYDYYGEEAEEEIAKKLEISLRQMGNSTIEEVTCDNANYQRKFQIHYEQEGFVQNVYLKATAFEF